MAKDEIGHNFQLKLIICVLYQLDQQMKDSARGKTKGYWGCPKVGLPMTANMSSQAELVTLSSPGDFLSNAIISLP